ncbi:F-box/LRR-repeat protein 4-like, partial [Pollicipes pollicipes]|uniref:F-box/LRR-repeat protein 4-like n=1 Tax=Pollicipes pollicipes TaxID=41117 RepID=UPI001884C6F1
MNPIWSSPRPYTRLQLSVFETYHPGGTTAHLRLEFNCEQLAYFTGLDAVQTDRLPAAAPALVACTHLRRLCADPVLYSQLDLQPYWHLVDASVVPFLVSRGSYLTKLDLSWCGSYGALTDADFCNVAAQLGSRLLCLRVDACDWFNGLCMEWTGLFCRGLEELSMRSCCGLADDAFWSLQYLCSLRRLDLFRTEITAAPLAAFIRNASGLQHLGL